MIRCLGALIALAVTFASGATPASGADVGEHCVVSVIGQRGSGELLVSDPVCYQTFEGAMRSEGVTAWGAGASARASSLAAATFTIGIHYDGANFTGPSTSVVGSGCTGGWLNVSAAWNDRISSTQNGCPRIRHYAGYNLTGASQTTYAPGGNLTTLNNLTSSIQYLS